MSIETVQNYETLTSLFPDNTSIRQHNIATAIKHASYNDRAYVPAELISFEAPFPEYQANLASSKDQKFTELLQNENEFLPQNPCGRTGLIGKGKLYHWGANQAVDAACIRAGETEPEILLIRRSDTGQYALPGGFVNKGEDLHVAASRELEEETGMKLGFTSFTPIAYAGYADDPRNTDNAWIETCVFVKFLAPEVGNQIVAHNDDAIGLAWVKLSDIGKIELYPTHEEFLNRILKIVEICTQ